MKTLLSLYVTARRCDESAILRYITTRGHEPEENRMTVTLFHGGVPDLAVGDKITPASNRFSDGQFFQYGSAGEPPYDPGLVYLTADVDVARHYANEYLALRSRGPALPPRSFYLPGDVYEVDAVGALKSDPDFLMPEIFFTAESATVRCIVERAVILSKSAAMQTLGF
jgi:hypothetical protein